MAGKGYDIVSLGGATKLSELWANAMEKKNEWNLMGNTRTKRRKHQEFVRVQKQFDACCRRHMRDKQLQLDQLNTSGHAELWRKIKELGPRRSYGPPIDVYNDEGHIIADTNCVLDTWANTYRKLYEPYEDTDNVFDKEFFETKLRELDLSDCDPASDNPILNETTWLNEIQNFISHAKNEKNDGFR